MKIKAVRLYGKNDLRLDEFDLREINPDEVLAKVICDSVCMSSYKTLHRGKLESVYPQGSGDAPIIIGHELAGEIVQVGARVDDKYKIGDRFGVQAAMTIDGVAQAPGYNFAEFGGAATHVIIPANVLPTDYLIWFNDDMHFYQASLGEPYACLLFALYGNFHTKQNTRGVTMGIREGGNMAIMGGCGPMGLGGVELILSMEKRPSLLIVTDIDQDRIDHASRLIPPEYAAGKGVELRYVNTSNVGNVGNVGDMSNVLLDLTNGVGFHDIFIMCPVKEVIELADSIGAYSCCINFFSGPVDTNLKAEINFHQVHYNAKHIIGSASSGVIDMVEIFDMCKEGRLRPEIIVTHVGGLNCMVDTISNLPSIPGGKKLIYTNIDMELTAIEEFGSKDSALFQELHIICSRNNMLWCGEAEEYLLKHGKKII